MSRPSRSVHDASPRRWLLAAAVGTLYAAALVGAVTALRAHRATSPRTTDGPTIGAAIPTAMRHPDRPSAYIVARAADCTGNFEFLDLFDRTPVRERLDLVGVLALGDESAATALRHALAAHGHELPVLPATPPLRSALATVGLRTTPYLLVLDGDGALRFATGAPESVRQYLALGRTLPLVADPMPTSSSADSRLAAGTSQ